MISRYHIIKDTSEREVDQLIEACLKTGYASFDYETNAAPIYNNDFTPTLLTVCYQPGMSIAIPLNHFESPFRDKALGGNGRWKKLIKKFGRKVIENEKVTKMAWNLKFDEKINNRYGVYLKGVALDGMLAKYILDEEKPHGLKEAVVRYLPRFANYQKENNIDKLPWDKKPLEPLAKYGGIDADATFRLSIFFEKKLIDLGFYSLYRNLIMMASKVLNDAEKEGLLVDRQMNLELEEKYRGLIETTQQKIRNNKIIRRFERALINDRKETYIQKLEDEIEDIISDGKALKKKDPDYNKKRNALLKKLDYRRQKIARIQAGEYNTKDELKIIEKINFGSQQQMAKLLYTHPKGFKFPIIEYTKDSKTNKPTQNPSTAEDVIKKLKPYDKYGFVDTLLELRGYEHTNSTFIVGWKERIQDDGKLHPTFFIHGTTSGRLSSKNPNGQQIPKMEVNSDIKPQIIAPPGHLFFIYDYSQAELRILAHLAKEKTMLEWFRDGKDIHLASACKKYNLDYDEILKIYEDQNHPNYKEWKIKRKQAKTINFGIVYEQTAMKLAESLSNPEEGIKVTVEEAQVFLDEFFELFPRIKRFMDKQHNFMEKHGYIDSLFGRRRRCPKVFGDNYAQYLEALRQSTNMPCQSAASDMALFASILTWEQMKLGKLPNMPEVNTVHDSVYRISLPQHINPCTVYKIWDICRNPETKKYFGFQINDVDMSMDFSVGRHIGEELDYIPGYDYSKMLDKDFDVKAYKELAKEYKKKNIQMKDYPRLYKQYFKEAA